MILFVVSNYLRLQYIHIYSLTFLFYIAIRESQRYFIPPVSSLLLLSFFTMAASFFGFQKLKQRGIAVSSKDSKESPEYLNVVHNFEEVKKE